MIDIVPYDHIGNIAYRWEIKRYGIVFGTDIEKELKEYYSTLQRLKEEEAEEHD